MGNEVNDWRLFYHAIFEAQLRALVESVRRVRVRDSDGYKGHPKTKLLASVYRAIGETVPGDPGVPEFRQGSTLGRGRSHWRRVKKGLPSRYRLFFRYSSTQRVIVYVWFNDEDTLRKAGSKTDVYSVFRRMLIKGKVPDSIDALLKQSLEPVK